MNREMLLLTKYECASFCGQIMYMVVLVLHQARKYSFLEQTKAAYINFYQNVSACLFLFRTCAFDRL